MKTLLKMTINTYVKEYVLGDLFLEQIASKVLPAKKEIAHWKTFLCFSLYRTKNLLLS